MIAVTEAAVCGSGRRRSHRGPLAYLQAGALKVLKVEEQKEGPSSGDNEAI